MDGNEYSQYLFAPPAMKKERVGSKAYELSFLLKHHMNVPVFIAMDAYIHGLYYSDIFSFLIENRSKSTEFLASSIEEKCSKITISDRFIRAFYQTISEHFPQTTHFSVRSSSLLEDGKNVSFAGQFKTKLHVHKDNLLTSIQAIWASAFSKHVLDYCNIHEIPYENLTMGIIIQEMIDSEHAGVIFTSHPRGLLNELVVVYGQFTGDYIVEDKINTTTYYYNKTDCLFSYEQQENAATASPRLLEEIINLGLQIEALYKYPTDIEFAIKEEIIYILQARPISTLKNQANIVLDNSNIVESYPHLSLPLTISFVKKSYLQVFYGLGTEFLPQAMLSGEIVGVLKDMVADVNGRLYYKITHWYEVLSYLPFRNKIIPVWEDMLGVENANKDWKAPRFSFANSISFYMKLFFFFLSTPKKMKALEMEFTDANIYFNDHFSSQLSMKELISLYDNISNRLFKNWHVTLMNDLYAFVFTGLLKNKLSNMGQEDKVTSMLSGILSIESMKPMVLLDSLYGKLMAKPRYRKELEKWQSMPDASEMLSAVEGDIYLGTDIIAYLNAYGDRGLEELKLESHTFRENPAEFVRYLLAYEPSERKRGLEAPSLPTGRLIHIYSDKVRLSIANRESSRLNRSRNFGMVRKIYLTIGKQMANQEYIDTARDIFYLTEEIVSKSIETGNFAHLKDIVLREKKKEIINLSVPNYSKLIFEKEIFEKEILAGDTRHIIEETHILQGIPCSEGNIEGEVVVILNPRLEDEVKDKILVTTMTEPGWVFLLHQAKGIIAEKGSLLSHTAIISRELKIPSIVGVKNATQRLKNGDMIRMDGSTGQIEVI